MALATTADGNSSFPDPGDLFIRSVRRARLRKLRVTARRSSRFSSGGNHILTASATCGMDGRPVTQTDRLNTSSSRPIRLDIAPICFCTARSGSPSNMHKMTTECLEQWYSATEMSAGERSGIKVELGAMVTMRSGMLGLANPKGEGPNHLLFGRQHRSSPRCCCSLSRRECARQGPTASARRGMAARFSDGCPRLR
jgi:hypothetical protein